MQFERYYLIINSKKMDSKASKKDDEKVGALMRLIIRPEKQRYDEEYCALTNLEEVKYERTIIPFVNSRGEYFNGSYVSKKGDEKRKCIVYMHGNGGCLVEG